MSTFAVVAHRVTPKNTRLGRVLTPAQAVYLLGSADLMSRNLDHRVEVVVPVEDTYVRNELESIFKAFLSDNAHAWELDSDGRWHRLKPKKGERRRVAQAVFVRRRDRARRLARAR